MKRQKYQALYVDEWRKNNNRRSSENSGIFIVIKTIFGENGMQTFG